MSRRKCIKKTSCPFSSLRKPKRQKSDGTHGFSVERTRAFALSNCGSYFNQEEWLKEFEDTHSTNEAKGQTSTSASHTKLLASRVMVSKVSSDEQRGLTVSNLILMQLMKSFK